MNILNIQTILIVNLTIAIVSTIFTSLLWFENRKNYKGIGAWALNFLFHSFALLLMSLRGMIPDFWSIFIANILIALAAWLLLVGLVNFVGKKVFQIHNYFIIIVYAIITYYYSVVHSDLDGRKIVLSAIILIMCSQCIWFLRTKIKKEIRSMCSSVSMVFVLYIILSISRITYVIFNPATNNNYLAAGAFEAVTLIIYLMLLAALGYSLIITVNQHLMLDIEAQKNLFISIFKMSPLAVVLTRMSDGKIKEVNKSFLKITGYKAEEIKGKTTIELNLWADPKDRQKVVKKLSEGKKVVAEEFLFNGKKGKKIIGEMTSEIFVFRGEPWIYSAINDITERKESEERLKKAAEELRNFNEKLVGRELKMVEMKQEIENLKNIKVEK